MSTKKNPTWLHRRCSKFFIHYSYNATKQCNCFRCPDGKLRLYFKSVLPSLMLLKLPFSSFKYGSTNILKKIILGNKMQNKL